MPEDVKRLSAPEYLAMLKLMDEDLREQRRQANKRKR